MHDVLIVSVPLLTIVAGLFFNNRAIEQMRSEMHELRSDMTRRFDRVDSDLMRFTASPANMKAG